VAENTPVDDTADELYSLTPGEFTRARDERAKELRAEGDREAANAVKALRKPTVAAWALNQLARTGRKDLDRLLAAGEELRAAQEELLAGGDRAGLQDKVATTLHAAALDEETAEELQAGRLTREREAIGGFRELGAGAAAPTAPRKAPEKRPAKRSSRQPSPDRQALTVARTDERHARRELDAAESAVHHAQERAQAAEAHAKEGSNGHIPPPSA
jgi:hypothetical protein